MPLMRVEITLCIEISLVRMYLVFSIISSLGLIYLYTIFIHNSTIFNISRLQTSTMIKIRNGKKQSFKNYTCACVHHSMRVSVTHKSEFYTQSVVLTRMSAIIIFVSIIITLIHVNITLCV
jgi:hypothetical protein